jgi:hypothetical protein
MSEYFNIEDWYKKQVESTSFQEKNDLWEDISNSLQEDESIESWYKKQIDNLSFDRKTTLWNKIESSLDRVYVWERIAHTLNRADKIFKIVVSFFRWAALAVLLLLPIVINFHQLLVFPKQTSSPAYPITSFKNNNFLTTTSTEIETQLNDNSITNNIEEKLFHKAADKYNLAVQQNNSHTKFAEVINVIDNNNTDEGNEKLPIPNSSEPEIVLKTMPDNISLKLLPLQKTVTLNNQVFTEMTLRRDLNIDNFEYKATKTKNYIGFSVQALQNWMFSNTFSQYFDKNSLSYMRTHIDYSYGVLYGMHVRKNILEFQINKIEKGQSLATYKEGREFYIDYDLNYWQFSFNYIFRRKNNTKGSFYLGGYSAWLSSYKINDRINYNSNLKTFDFGFNAGYKYKIHHVNNQTIIAFAQLSHGVVNLNNTPARNISPLYNANFSVGIQYVIGSK